MSRIGKIARLDKCLRDELGHWIEDGVPGKEIVEWLNGEPQVREVLAEYFEGQAITEQNLSDWRQGGHQEWLQYKTASKAVLEFMDNTEGLIDCVSTKELVTRLSSMFAAELMQTSMGLLARETDLEKKWKRLCEVHRELSRLRRDEQREWPARLKEESEKAERDRLYALFLQRQKAKRALQEAGKDGAEVKAPACAKAAAVVSQGVEHACGKEAEKGCHRGTESTAGGGEDRERAKKPVKDLVKGRKSKRIVANRVKKTGTDGRQKRDGITDGSGRTNARDARSTIPTGEKSLENPQESGPIVANRVKKGISLESPVKRKMVNGERVYEHVSESMEKRLERIRALEAIQLAAEAKEESCS